MSLRPPDINYKLYFTIVILFGLLPASMGYMYTEGMSSEVTRLQIDGAPGGIVFIADPHLRASNINHTREIIRQINDLHPSVVLIGGDFTYGEGNDEKELALQDVWSSIHAPVYAVLGNHDYKSGINSSTNLQKFLADPKPPLQTGDYNAYEVRDPSADYEFADRMAGVLARNGVTVLRNQYKEITIDNRSVLIVGVDDGWAGMADPPSVPKNDSFIIYMIHEPAYRGNWDANLTLAGHTHGGQIIPAGMERIFSAGLVVLSGEITEGNKITYISRGIGTSNLDIQLRASPPEIVYITSPQKSGSEHETLVG
jgi:uncharacterized protein